MPNPPADVYDRAGAKKSFSRRSVMRCNGQSGKPIKYQIHIRGKLDPKWSEWFAGFLITHTNGETVLQGTVPDQSALYGILAKIHDLGLTLIRVEQLPEELDLSP
jgi:hypothetical protein